MLRVDLSKALPPKPYLYFSAFLPGLFFEFSILLANPDLACQLALRSQEGLALGRYFVLFVGLFFAFVIGNTLMLFVSLIQYAIGYVYRIGAFLWEQYQRQVLLPILTRLTHASAKRISASGANPNSTSTPNPIPRPGWTTPAKWVGALYVRTLDKVERFKSTKPTAAYLWWDALARQLLLKRYDLTEDKLPAASFQPLQSVLTTPSAEEMRGSVLVNASQATGWAAICACRFAPALWNKGYIIFALFLIGFGLLHDFLVARRLFDPDIGDVLRLRAVLREFPRLQSIGTAPGVPPNPSDEEES